MFKVPERCPFCLNLGTVEVLENDTWEFLDKNRRPFQVSGYVCFHCTACGEKSVDGTMDKLNHPKVLDARRVSESLLSSNEIKQVLAKIKELYGFSESQLEDILGIGAKSFARWKSGAVCQSNTADALLRALYIVPSIIEDIAKARGLAIVPIKRGRPTKASGYAEKPAKAATGAKKRGKTTSRSTAKKPAAKKPAKAGGFKPAKKKTAAKKTGRSPAAKKSNRTGSGSKRVHA